jgi:hypothetical protein
VVVTNEVRNLASLGQSFPNLQIFPTTCSLCHEDILYEYDAEKKKMTRP